MLDEKKQISGESHSLFRLISMGTAVENKPRDSTLLNVLMNEKAMATDGELAFNPVSNVRKYADSSGAEHQVKTTQERSVPCEWLPSEDNRATPPDIRRNELVEVWRLGDSDKYYWRSMALRNELRALESVVYVWNASPNPAGGGIDFSTCYYMAVSAHDKLFTIGTSMANGEPFAWTLQINTGLGTFTITDDIGNEFEIVSDQNRLQLKNADGTFVKLERKTIVMSADESIEFIVGGTTHKMTPESIAIKTTTMTTKTDQYTVNGGVVVIEGMSIALKTSKFDIIG